MWTIIQIGQWQPFIQANVVVAALVGRSILIFLEENTFIFPLSGSEIYVNFGIFKLSKFLERFNFIRISFIYSSLCSSRAALSIIF